MVSLALQLQNRFFSTKIQKNVQNQWKIKQITKSNFTETFLQEFKAQIFSCDFISISLKRTGSFTSPWHHISPFDTPQIAYLKAKHAAEKFQILQFSICPFTLSSSSSKVTAYPYNFHLFPRDEHRIEMPAYSFSCDSSYLSKLIQQGFDFNAAVSDGISYLSRAQESAGKVQMGDPHPVKNMLESTAAGSSVADAIFVKRTRSRVKNWLGACKNAGRNDEALVQSLRKLVMGLEEYYKRPCMTLEVCSERQVQLLTEMLQEFADDLVPIIIPTKGGGTQAVRAVLISSKEDRDLLQMELQNSEDEQNRKMRGFREVVDLISASKKPIVSHNSLNDLTFIHSNFLEPLPHSMDEFMCALHLAFPLVIDVNHLMKEINPMRKLSNLPMATSYLKNRFFAPVDLEIPFQENGDEDKSHGHDVVKICQLFVKLCYILKLSPNSIQTNDKNLASEIEAYANVFSPFSPGPQEPTDEDIRIWTNNPRKINSQDLVFLWGFRNIMSAGTLKSLLQHSHEVFSKEFDIRFVDKSCAIVVFWEPGLAKTLLDILSGSLEISGPLREMVAEGVRAAGYDTYSRACNSYLWEENLADSLDKVSEDPIQPSDSDFTISPSNTHGCNEWMINLDEL